MKKRRSPKAFEAFLDPDIAEAHKEADVKKWHDAYGKVSKSDHVPDRVRFNDSVQLYEYDFVGDQWKQQSKNAKKKKAVPVTRQLKGDAEHKLTSTQYKKGFSLYDGMLDERDAITERLVNGEISMRRAQGEKEFAREKYERESRALYATAEDDGRVLYKDSAQYKRAGSTSRDRGKIDRQGIRKRGSIVDRTLGSKSDSTVQSLGYRGEAPQAVAQYRAERTRYPKKIVSASAVLAEQQARHPSAKKSNLKKTALADPASVKKGFDKYVNQRKRSSVSSGSVFSWHPM